MSPMTLPQQIMTIALCVIATMLTRFLPFLVFSGKKETPQTVQYLGKALPLAVFGDCDLTAPAEDAAMAFPNWPRLL